MKCKVQYCFFIIKGEGSCGNGGAMRISPAALYGYNDDATLIEVC